jgi:D-glycero-D-manno-heptose 1,7-bisphosphate phosphatase
VLNVDHGHVATPERFEWVPGAREAVKAVNDAGMLAIAVTNQAGIAKGLYTQDEYLAFERWIAECLAEGGAHLDAVYHCPHHPEGQGEFRVVCECRKPAPGMVLSAIADWGLDTGSTVLLGDKASDLEAARAAGVEGVRFDGGDLRDAVIPLIEKLAGAR